ncbi:hypothetical protein ISS03_01740 [Patescibacteria group bacterium]|nr:hypothetical protein [Patescibacteria group bacterium]
MSHDIDSDFVEYYDNNNLQCNKCDSLSERNGELYCSESDEQVPSTGHCNFFRSID